MKVNYKYSSPSMCMNKGNESLLGLSPDLSREESVSFLGKVKNPLLFRDSMLMLREIVVSDMRQGKKERVDFFNWLNDEIEKRVQAHKDYQPDEKSKIKKEMDSVKINLEIKENEIKELIDIKNQINKEIQKYDIWSDYNKIERDFWNFIRDRDYNLWFVLDPVITVHRDMVSFEAFSLDESTYGCLSVNMDEFELLQEPSLGTTNIDFSDKLAREMERFRSYTDVKLSVNPGGFTVDSEVMPEYIEKKIDLPESWIKGFNQVSSAASLTGMELNLSPVDMYDICSFLRRNKEKKGPRYMKWILEPGKNIKILFEPFGKILTLKAKYNGAKKREEKIWGRRRWLVMEKLIPVAKSFNVKLLGFGMPQFIIADMGNIKMTIGFSAWSANDWVKGTSFNILGGFIGEGNYDEVYSLMKKDRALTIDEINESLSDYKNAINKSGIGMLFRKGEGYFDLINNKVRFRQLCNVPIDEELYKVTELEKNVLKILNESMENLVIKHTNENEYISKTDYKVSNPNYYNWNYRNDPNYKKATISSNTEIIIDAEGQISQVKCNCDKFNKGAKNVSEPCEHILALYANTSKFLKLDLEVEKEYKIKDIMEILL